MIRTYAIRALRIGRNVLSENSSTSRPAVPVAQYAYPLTLV